MLRDIPKLLMGVDKYMRNIDPEFKKEKTEALFGAISQNKSFYRYNKDKNNQNIVNNQQQQLTNIE